MLEPPDLSNDAIIAAVRTHYGIPVAALTFLPIGHDSSAWVYRAQAADGAAYFLKVRTGTVNVAGLVVPRYLHDRGVAEVVAPLMTTARAVSVGLGAFTLAVYPFVVGTTGMAGGMTEQQWTTYGAVLRQVHAMPLVPELTRHMHRETFAPAWSDMVRRLDAHVATDTNMGPVACELAAFWRARQAEILALVERAEALGRRLRATVPPLVLCHADVHTGNVLVDTAGQLRIVDWDETVLAPKERDLTFVVGGIRDDLVGPREEAWFFRGYGPATVDPLALAYYRYAWAVGDVGAYGEQAFLMPGLGVTTRRAAVRGLTSLFQPGQIVALAYASEGAGT